MCVCLPTRPSVNCLRTSPLPLSSLLVSVSLQSLGSQTASSIPRVYRGQDLVLAMIGVGSRFETPTSGAWTTKLEKELRSYILQSNIGSTD